MPKHSTVLQVFLSSPSDLDEERGVVADVLSELNRVLEPSTGLTLVLVRWGTGSRPAIGTDTQAVLNSQLPTDYDIYLGMMGERFGTPTPRAGSGTLEEFEDALKRHRADKTGPSIMFYFKASPVNPFDVDPAQLAAVQSFRSRLRGEGILYKTFDHIEDLQSQLRIHLADEARTWQERLSASTRDQTTVALPPTGAGVSHATATEGDDDAGVFDLILQANECFGIAASALDSLSQALQQLNSQTTERAAQMNAVASNAEPSSHIQQARGIAKRLGGDMAHFVARANAELPVLSENLHEAIRAYGLAMTLARDFGPQAIPPLTAAMDGVVGLRKAIEGAMVNFGSVRETVSKLPRVQKDFNVAKRDTLRVFDTFLGHTRSADDLLSTIATDIGLLLTVLRESESAG